MLLGSAVTVILGLVACGTETEPARSLRPAGDGPVTIAVPADAPTISAAVAAARPGDLVLIGPGTYRESVAVTVPGITLRGTTRAGVVIDGEILRANGVIVTAPDVTVQNLTVRNNTLNGVLVTGMSDETGGLARGSGGYTTLDPAKFPPLQGFHVDHVTSYNNGLYGIYAFDAQYGLIENTFTSGMADSGIYVGQCKPCHTVVRDNVAERNAVGYEGANAGGELYVTGNRLVGNRVGLTTNSDYQEAFIPQAGATLSGNLIAANNQQDTPQQADGGFGIGVGIAGGTDNLVTRNAILGNTLAGLVLGSVDDLAPSGNQVTANAFTDNGVDVAYTASSAAPGTGNCLADNALTSTLPAGLDTTLLCPGDTAATAGSPLGNAGSPPGIPFTDVVAPPAQPELPDPTRIPAAWSDDQVPAYTGDLVTVPDAGLLADRSAIRW